MFESYAQMDAWELLANPPPGTVIDFFRGTRSARWYCGGPLGTSVLARPLTLSAHYHQDATSTGTPAASHTLDASHAIVGGRGRALVGRVPSISRRCTCTIDYHRLTD